MPEPYPETKAAAIIALNTGFRRMEILRLKATAIVRRTRTAIVRRKGGKTTTDPLNARAWAVISELLQEPAPGGFLFHRRAGNNLSGARGSFHLAMKRVKITGFRFHDLRHTFASRVRMHTDAFTVRDLMGHSDVKTTNIYANATMDERRRAVEALCSAARVLPFVAQQAKVSP